MTAQAQSHAYVWTTVEIQLESHRDRENPYLDVDVEAVFTGPNGEQIKRPAFWNGGRSWLIRFAPTRPGLWTYRVNCGDPTDGGLNGLAGSIVGVEADSTASDIYRHGFLRSAERYLAFDDGTPFFWLGDTHWRFLWEKWDEASKTGWHSQFREMVDRRVEQGFTVYQTNLLSFEDGWNAAACWATGEEYRRIDVGFFESVVDPRMAYIADAGLVNAMGLAWHEAIDHPDAPAGLARLARYVVARYGSLPMVWTMAGEVAGYNPALREARINGWRTVAKAIAETDGYGHPRTAHLTNERPIASYYQNEDWLTLTLNQLGHGDHDLNPKHYIDFRAQHPNMPLVEGEALYEGLSSVESVGRRTVTETMVRQVAYRAIQSGCCGYTYGAQGCWNNARDIEDGATTWGNLPWFEGIDLPGATQLGHLRRFYSDIDWSQLRPDAECFVTEDIFNRMFFLPSVSSNRLRTTVVAYFGETYRNGGGAARLTHLAERPYELRWFDPRCGDYSAAESSVVPTHGMLAIPDKPDDGDWIRLAEAL